MLDLLRRTLIHEPLHEALVREKIWDDPRYEAALAVHTGPAHQPTGLAVGVVRERAGALSGVVKLMCVAPECQGRGLGRALLTHLEQGFAARGLTKLQLGSSPPNYLTPGLDPRYHRALRFFQAAGYERVGETQNLVVALADLPALSPDAALRRAETRDRPALEALLARHWPSWIPEVGVAFAQSPPSLHLAFAMGQPIAFAAYNCNNLGTGFFGPMGTDPAHRGRGLGRELLLRCLHDLAAQGQAKAIIPWVGPVEFYRQTVNALPLRSFFMFDKCI